MLEKYFWQNRDLYTSYEVVIACGCSIMCMTLEIINHISSSYALETFIMT